MLAFGCNRRNNGFQLENSLNFLACGVSDRVNSYLHYIGLTSSRQTANRAMKTLGKETENAIKFEFTKPTTLAPLICVDNIDFEQRIHQRRLDRSTKMFHGSWGYVHFLKPNLLSNLNPDQFTLSRFKESMNARAGKRIDPGIFFPDKHEQDHWVSTLKAQIGSVLLRYISDGSQGGNLPIMKAPVVDQILAEQPNIMMLKMMDSSDNSAEGVGELYIELIRQSGLDPEKFSERLQVIEGDLGTCLNFECLRNQRLPSSHSDESLGHILNLPGAAHTLWNVAQAFWLAHWGDPQDRTDMGAWRGVVALGGRAEKPIAKKDFTSMIGWIRNLHDASITHCIL